MNSAPNTLSMKCLVNPRRLPPVSFRVKAEAVQVKCWELRIEEEEEKEERKVNLLVRKGKCGVEARRGEITQTGRRSAPQGTISGQNTFPGDTFHGSNLSIHRVALG
ncbi:hypothetical protein E2C01_078564 [Portunus trituberculatus]|uniref:Uncharacterized protein n=1 Tax=Portunus trituberculatus TaxID=210409 RepID=A0A5B7IUG3_PORTR|nr:hypothetical protein [Portunus trituberculatus]